MSSPQPPSAPADPGHPSSQPAAGTSVLEREELRESVEPGDHERYAHYVRKEKIVSSAMSGQPVVALCGKVWTPGRDPKKYPVCPACKAIYEGINAGGGEGSGRGRFGRGGKGGKDSSGSGE